MKWSAAVFIMILGSLARASIVAPACRQAFRAASEESYHFVLQSLAKLRMRLEENRVNGSSKQNRRALESDFETKQTQLALDSGVDPAKIEDDLRAEVGRLQGSGFIPAIEKTEPGDSERARTEKAINNSTTDGSRIITHQVLPGSYTKRRLDGVYGYYKVEVEITKPFYMASTLTTQVVWRRILAAGRERLKSGKHYASLSYYPSNHLGDLYPVEKVSWLDISNWLEILNGLSEADDPIVWELFPNHIQGAVYRLPTESEWSYVAMNRGNLDRHYPFPNEELGRNAWFRENSGQKTQLVGTKRPLIFDGNQYFDLYGNVAEWTLDRLGNKPTEGVDPREERPGWHFLAVGGSASSMKVEDCAKEATFDSSLRSSFVGFRLVMTAAPAK